MLYLPGTCDHCRTIALICCVERSSGCETCASCGGNLSALPVAAYPEGDVLLFNELLTLSEGSGIAGREAEELATIIEKACSTVDEREAFSVAAFGLPELAPLAPLLAANSARARQALSMLDTILRALSQTQRPSGILQRAPASANVGDGHEPADWQDVGPLSRMGRDDGSGGWRL